MVKQNNKNRGAAENWRKSYHRSQRDRHSVTSRWQLKFSKVKTKTSVPFGNTGKISRAHLLECRRGEHLDNKN